MNRGRRAEMNARKQLRRQADLANAVCAVCDRARAVDLHHCHTAGRGGKASAENMIPVCRECHRWLDTEPAEAYDKGWLKHSWDAR